MFNLKRLTLAITLAAILTGSAFAGETSSPPCMLPDPGETSSPPCPSSLLVTDVEENANAVPGESEAIIYEAATDAIETLLTIF